MGEDMPALSAVLTDLQNGKVRLEDLGPEIRERLARFRQLTEQPRNTPWNEGLRAPFRPDEISVKPRLWCTACSKAEGRVCPKHKQIQCKECKNRISEAHLHLSYVGHAEATSRLLEVDPYWDWEPAYRDVDKELLMAAIATGNHEIVTAVIANAPPLFDREGGMWMRVMVHDDDNEQVWTLGYGDAEGKRGPAAMKEIIGDGIRNAMMRRGLALDLWSRSDRALEAVQAGAEQGQPGQRNPAQANATAGAARPAQGRKGAKLPENGELVVEVQDLANLAGRIAREWLAVPVAERIPVEEALEMLRTQTHAKATGKLMLGCTSPFDGQMTTLSQAIQDARHLIEAGKFDDENDQ